MDGRTSGVRSESEILLGGRVNISRLTGAILKTGFDSRILILARCGN
jgi:hypothetical protein